MCIEELYLHDIRPIRPRKCARKDDDEEHRDASRGVATCFVWLWLGWLGVVESLAVRHEFAEGSDGRHDATINQNTV